MTFRLTGPNYEPGTFAVLDYTRSLTMLYDPKSRSCFVIGGIRKEIADPTLFTTYLEKNITRPAVSTRYSYQIADTYPISDKSILPRSVMKSCAYLPTYWLEPVPAGSEKGIVKRDIGVNACLELCLKVLIIELCAKLCLGLTVGLPPLLG
jgi:hypothetical protein